MSSHVFLLREGNLWDLDAFIGLNQAAPYGTESAASICTGFNIINLSAGLYFNVMASSLHRQALGMIFALGIQYLLGMYTNLFISFPETNDRNALWGFAFSQPALILHILLGILILVGAAVLFVRSIMHKSSRWMVLSGVSLLGVLAAVFGGESFIGSQNEIYSFLMATGFMIAIFSYMIALIAGLRDERLAD